VLSLKRPPKTASYRNYICTKALVYPYPKSLRTKNHEKYITLSKLLRKLKQ